MILHNKTKRALWFTFCWSGYTPTLHWIVIKLLSANRKPYILAYMTDGDAIENDSRSSLAWVHLFWDLKQINNEINGIVCQIMPLSQWEHVLKWKSFEKRETLSTPLHIFFASEIHAKHNTQKVSFVLKS